MNGTVISSNFIQNWIELANKKHCYNYILNIKSNHYIIIYNIIQEKSEIKKITKMIVTDEYIIRTLIE